MSNEIPFHKRINVVSVDEDFWREHLRPALLKSKYAPKDEDEDINDFVLYEDGRIILPKYFWHATYHYLKKRIQDIDKHILLPKIIPENKIDVNLREGVKPREYQQKVIDDVLQMYKNKRHIRAIIRGTTGFGKTFVAIYIIAKTGLQPIIIVHNETLFKQWKGALLEYLDIEEDDIGLVQGSNVEKIKKELEKPIVIVKIQSLLSQVKRIPLSTLYDLYKSISLVIMDESHITSAAQKFAKVTSVFSTPNIIGLSATPYRRGLHQLIMDTNIGTTIIESDHKNLIPHVYVKYLNCSIDSKTKVTLSYVNDYVRKLAMYNKSMTESSCFIPKIAQDILKLAAEGRHILAIMGNNTQVKRLTELLKANGIAATSFIASNRKIPEKTQVIVSNNQMASTGFSIDSLDTLILANSNIGKVLLIQTVGRIVRAMTNKKQPQAYLYFTLDFNEYINDKTSYIIENNLRAEYGDALKINFEYEEA